MSVRCVMSLPRLAAVLGVCLAVAGVASLTGAARAGDWPMWGRDMTRNMVSPETGIPTEWDTKTGKNIKWKVPLGSQSYGNPVVAGGFVFVGTNNEGKRDPSKTGDGNVTLIFRESNGEFVYQHHSPKLKSGRVNDWPFIGNCSSALVEGDHVWFCSNSCEVICLDMNPVKSGSTAPALVWKLDMMDKLGVFPHNSTPCSIPASYKGFIYVITGNGVDETHESKPSPLAPSLVCLDKLTGKVIWTDNSPGNDILHGQYSNPLVMEIGGRAQVITPQGDGWLRSFDAATGKLLWKFDTNRKNTVFRPGGGTRNEIIATPVYYDGKIYIANGQDPEHGEGPAVMYCIDPTKTGDISPELDDGPLEDLKKDEGEKVFFGQPRKSKPNPNSGLVWKFDKLSNKGEDQFHRTISTVAVHDGLVIAPDLSGFVHCLDAKTGEKYWTYDMLAAIWASPLIVDGKVYIGDEDGDVAVFKLSKKLQLISEVNLGSSVYSSAIVANGVLYLMSKDTLFAIQEKK